jgi:hypothetical protein
VLSNVHFLFSYHGKLEHSLGDLRMKLPRLSLRIWHLLEARAEGLPAIGALGLIVLGLLVVKYLSDL